MTPLLNRATWRQRLWMGLVALSISIPWIAYLSDLSLVWHLSRAGMTVPAKIIAVHSAPAVGRPYSVFTYSYGGKAYKGKLSGASGRAKDDILEVTVDQERPATYWVGNASQQLLQECLWVLVGSVWLAVGAAFLFRIPGGMIRD